MSQQKSLDWLRLDNAGKIFPSTSSKRNTGVFRLACELVEPVNPDCLQQALDAAIDKFPQFLYVLRSGVFWYYLEKSQLRPMIHEEDRPLCGPLFNRNKRTLLFDVSYYRNKVSLDIYHALSDGMGAMMFFKTLLCHYLALRYGLPPSALPDQSAGEPDWADQVEDSFRRYYKDQQAAPSVAFQRAYQLKGPKVPQGYYQMIEGRMSCRQALAVAAEHHTSLTILLGALLIQAIHRDMVAYQRDKRIVLTIPVNLRKYFPSETTRNFFGNIRIPYRYSQDEMPLEAIIDALSQSFHQELTPDNLQARLNRLMAFEQNPALKAVPLAVKNQALRLIRHLSDLCETAVISNIGRVDLPEAMRPHVKHASIYSCTSNMHICLCSFGDQLCVSFTTIFLDTEIQKHFFRSLVDLGLAVEIRSNQH